MRITVSDVMQSRIPAVLGICSNDLPVLLSYVNEAQQRLVNAGGDSGWMGSWDKIVFNVSQDNPYITLPPQYARLGGLNVCRNPVRIQNFWYETLEAGIGIQKPCAGRNGCGAQEAYERGLFPTAYDLPTSNQYLRIYTTDVRDVNAQVIVNQAKDQNGLGIYGQVGQNTIDGFLMILDSPFVTTDFIVTSFVSITKAKTYGDIVLKAVDATTGAETFLSRYTPDETNPTYRRYYINRLPRGCCNASTPGQVQVTALCKYDYKPALRPTDVLIIGNIPALKSEVESIRYSEMDNGQGKQFSLLAHAEAIKLLNQELTHYFGTSQPAINFAPFGTAALERQAIGTMV